MIIGYSRGGFEGPSPEQEKADLIAAGCHIVVTDTDLRRDLPELQHAVKRLRAGDVLVVPELARLGHAVPDVLRVMQQIEARSAHLRSLCGGIDTSAAPELRPLVFRAIAALAGLDRRQRGERARRGMKAAQRRGRHVGRPPKLQEAHVRVASERIRAGEELADVARELGVSALTLRRNLQALQPFEGEPGGFTRAAQKRRTA